MKVGIALGLILALVLSIFAVYATHDTGTNTTDTDDDSENLADDACEDVNPNDSVNTCLGAEDTTMIDDTEGDSVLTTTDTMTVSDTTDSIGTATVSDPSEWIELRCRLVADSGDTTTVSDTTTGTRTTAGMNTAGTDRTTTSDTTGRASNTIGNTNVDNARTTVSDDERGTSVLECYVADESRSTLLNTMTVSERSWTGGTRVNTADTTGATDTDATRGFESPVVYTGTLDTSRTENPEADANDVIGENGGTTG